MKLLKSKINVFIRGDDAIVAVPERMAKGAADLAASIATLFQADPKTVGIAKGGHKDVPEGFIVLRIKGYKRPHALVNPGDKKYVAWSEVNEVEDKNLGLIDTSSGAVAVGRGAHEDAKPAAKSNAASEARALAEEIEGGDGEIAALRAEIARLTKLVEDLPTRAEINELATAFAHLSRAVTGALGARAK